MVSVNIFVNFLIRQHCVNGLDNRGERIMLKNLPIMLCCTAPIFYLLCSTISLLCSKLCLFYGTFLSTLCFDDCTWFFRMLSFSDSSSRQAEQNSFPADTVTISSKNSLALCATLISFGSIEQAGFFFHAPVCGGSPYACASSPIVWEL